MILNPLLGVDFGTKKCGLAWSPDGVLCFPLKVIDRDDLTLSIKDLIQEKAIKTVVFGLPIDGDGIENQMCKDIRAFAESFSSQAEVSFVNERGSSQNVSNGTQERIDDLAACEILEFWLAKSTIK